MSARHFVTEAGGRFAVGIENNTFVMAHLTGTAPQPGHLYLAIETWPELQAAANEAAATRRNPYAVERREGMSGAVDYRLRECRDPSTGNYPVRATVHVSMYGKINQGIRIWLGDLAPLCWSMFVNHPFRDGQTVAEVEIFCPASGWSDTPLRFVMDEEGLAVAGPPRQENDETVAWALLATLDTENTP